MTIAPPPVGDDERGKDYTLASAEGADEESSTSGGRDPWRGDLQDWISRERGRISRNPTVKRRRIGLFRRRIGIHKPSTQEGLGGDSDR